MQIVAPLGVVEDLLGTILTVQSYVTMAVIVVGVATLATMTLVFMLSLQLRRREIETMVKIGGSRWRVTAVLAAEIVLVLGAGVVLAMLLASLTALFGAQAMRLLVMGA